MGLFEKVLGKKIADQLIPQKDKDYNKLLGECIEEITLKNKKLQEEFGFGTHSRWDIDQQIGDLVFSDNGEVKLIAEVIFLGTYSLVSNTWLWSWANETIFDNLKKEMEIVKQYGHDNGYSDLTTPQLEATEADSWGLAAFATRILNGMGIFRPKSEGGYTFMMIKEIKKP